MVIAALIYFLAGYHKVRRSGLDWAIGDNVRYVMLWGPSVGQAAWEGLSPWVAERDWASQATAAFILAFKVTFPVVLFALSLLPPHSRVPVSFTVLTWVFMALAYCVWPLTCLALFSNV